MRYCVAGGIVLAGIVLLTVGCGTESASAPEVRSDTNPITYVVNMFTDDGAVVGLDNGSLWSVLPADRAVVVGHWNLDSQLVTIGKGGHMLVDLEEAGAHNIRASQIGTIDDQNSYDHAGDNTLTGIGHGAYFAGGADGAVLTLEDGSIWAVNDPTDQQIDSLWADGDNVVVRHGSDGMYTLVDTDVETRVEANYIAQEAA